MFISNTFARTSRSNVSCMLVLSSGLAFALPYCRQRRHQAHLQAGFGGLNRDYSSIDGALTFCSSQLTPS